MSNFLLILISGIGLGALYFLVASGLSLIYGLMGVLNFAHGTFLTIGAFGGLWVTNYLMPNMTTKSFVLGMGLGGIFGGLFAILVEQLVITRLYERHIDQALVLQHDFTIWSDYSSRSFSLYWSGAINLSRVHGYPEIHTHRPHYPRRRRE